MAVIEREQRESAQVWLDALIKEARERQRRRRRRAAIACLAVLVLGCGIAAAFGGSGPGGGEAAQSPHPGAIAARVADPAGGPGWGIRIVRSDGDRICVQLGRLRGSTLGVIGQDGAFANHGLFHPIFPSTVTAARCASTDPSGRAFLNILDW